jgi:replicative DNA helicase
VAVDIAFDRALPHSLEAERSVLGAILLDNSALNTAVARLRGADFYRDAHRRLFEAMLRLAEKKRAIDFVTLKDELGRGGDLEAAGGAAGLAALTDGVPRSANVEHYAGIVKDKAVLRELIGTANRVIQESLADSDDASQILDAAEKAIFAIAEDQYRGGFTRMDDLAAQGLAQIQSMSGHHGLTGIPTGFQGLDAMTSGLQRSDLILIAGRPSMGKTAFCLNIAQHAAVEEGRSVGIFSLEMSKEQLFLRMLCGQARVDSHRLRTGRLDQAAWRDIGAAVDVLSQARIFIDDTPGVPVLEMRAKARRLAAEHGLDLLVIDYLQLMRGRGRYENRNLEVTDISRSLKELAKELNIPVVALSQLSRSPEQRARTDKRPQLGDLRESGALEQDADVVIFLYRPGLYNPEEQDETFQSQAEVIVGKQRNGPTGSLDLVFVRRYARFENPATREEAP